MSDWSVSERNLCLDGLTEKKLVMQNWGFSQFCWPTPSDQIFFLLFLFFYSTGDTLALVGDAPKKKEKGMIECVPNSKKICESSF